MFCTTLNTKLYNLMLKSLCPLIQNAAYRICFDAPIYCRDKIKNETNNFRNGLNSKIVRLVSHNLLLKIHFKIHENQEMSVSLRSLHFKNL